MNDKQKLLVMVGTGSLLVFLITIFGLGFSPIHRWLDTSEINWEYEKSNVDFDNEKEWYKWAEDLKYEKVDFILCDWNLHDHNGASLLKALRKSDKYNHIPFVMVSALQDAGTIALNDELGGDEYLIKPINIDTIKEKLQIVWEKHTLETEGDVHRLLLRINELEQENSFLEERLRQVKNSISL